MSLYDNWRNMHRRCSDETYHSYHRYGGRGIKVCTEWQSFEHFKADMAGSYEPGLTLDRRDNNKGYSKDNCRWLPKESNTKPGIADPQHVLTLYNSGLQQKELAVMFNTDQPHISRILKRARRGAELS